MKKKITALCLVLAMLLALFPAVASAAVVSAEAPVKIGDVDGSGTVDSDDRTILARYLAHWPGYETINEKAADVDENGIVDADDRIILARYLAHWEEYSRYCLDPSEPQKVLFIGNSFIYYGKTVLEKGNDKLDLSTRVNDKGYFYELCKENGLNVSVTNWTFGGHDLSSIIDEKPCKISKARACYGECHVDYLTDKVYDVVVVSPGTNYDNFVGDLTTIKEMFTKANRKVKFICLCAASLHGCSVSGTNRPVVLNNLKTVEKMGYAIADWGGFVNGIVQGNIKVPDSKYQYDRNSFIIRKSEDDGYHPNQLAGYITTLMTYCVLTGSKAEGQPFAFATDATINSNYKVSTFMNKNYVAEFMGGATTNYDKILQDADEMLQIQKLVDAYLADQAYLNYNFAE